MTTANERRCTMTLTRRDRAAMVLALECLRQSPLRTGQYDWLPRARLVLEHGGNSADDLALALDPPVKCSLRLLRARLALYLRAVLRADSRLVVGGRSVEVRVTVSESGVVSAALHVAGAGRAGGGGRLPGQTRRIRPLWEDAKRFEPQNGGPAWTT